MNDLQTRILIYSKDGINLKPIKIYKDDEGKNWIEAKNNTKFVIEIKNNTYEKILSVISIDGLSVISGEQAELKPNNGYILDPYRSTKINGWRTSLTEVREFVFTNDKKESYSHKLGANENNIGVIGIAFFKEKKIWVPFFDTIQCSNTNTFSDFSRTVDCVFSNAIATTSIDKTKEFTMATKQGQSIADKVSLEKAEFEENPFIIDTIYYDSRENLIEKGIIKEQNELPQPFGSPKFCPSL